MGIRFDARQNKIITDGTSVDFDQPVQTVASTTSAAGLNIPEGVAPSAPVDGDVWVTAAGAFNARLNGATVDLSAGGATNLTWTASTRTVASDTGTDAVITLFTSTEAGLTPLSGGGTTNFLRADGTWAAPGGGITGTVADNQIVTGTGASTVDSSANLTYDATTMTISSGVLPSAPTLELTSTRPVLVFDETDAAADNGRWYQHASAETFQLVAINDANSVSNPIFTATRTGTTVDSFDVAATSFTAYSGGATATHYLGIDASNNFNFEVGSNYGIIQLEDDNVSTETQTMSFDLVSSSSGAREYQFLENGGLQVGFDITNNTFTFNGALEILAKSDHGPSFFSGGCMLWARSESLGDELYYTTGDNSSIDHTLQNVMEAGYQFSSTTAAADPGAGVLRFNNATPASVTQIYFNDAESTGKDASYLLSNLADGDIIKVRDVNTAGAYLVASVNGATTDNTGWWTIPVTVIHSGTLPTNTGPLQVDVEWAGSQGGGTIAGSITDNQVAVGAATANSIEGSAGFTFDATTNTLSIYDTTDAERLQISNSLTQAVLNTNTGSSIAFQQGGSAILTLASGTSTITSNLSFSGTALDINMLQDGIISWGLGEIYATNDDFVIGAKGSSTGNDFFLQTNRSGTAKDGIIIRNNFAVEVYYNGVLKFQTSDETAADNSSGAEVVDGSGTLRSVGFNLTPQVVNNATNVPFTQAQVGYDIISDNVTAYTWTTNASTGTAQTDIPAGSMWKCTNLGSGNITIAAGTSVTLYWLDGSGTTGSRTLGQWGTCTVYKYSNTIYHIWGTGLS